MKVKPECYPCILKALLKTARRVSEDEWLLRKVLGETMDVLRNSHTERTPPDIAAESYIRMAKLLGNRDPYAQERRDLNTLAKKVLPAARRLMSAAADPLFAALKIAAVANQLDALTTELSSPQKILDAYDATPFHAPDYEEFRNDIQNAATLLFIFDNAGEIVFDTLLIECLKKVNKNLSVTGVVRRAPMFNDATYEDAADAGADRLATLTDCGIDVVGTPLHTCSKQFRDLFLSSDLVLAKGQGNYETLEGEVRPGQPFAGKAVYFLLTIKCEVIASFIGRSVGDAVLMKEG